MPQVPFEVDDAIVLLLGARTRVPALTDRLEGITRLEKLLFLLEKETDIAHELTEKLDFHAHNFGPFSSKVYQAIETLSAAKLVQDDKKATGLPEDSWEAKHIVGAEEDPYVTRTLTLTDKGRRYFKALLKDLPANAEEQASDLKARFGALPLRQLIRYVYVKYPKYTAKSIIRKDIMGT